LVKTPWIAALLFVAASAGAQNFPAKPVTIVVPFPPGGSNDVFARSLGKCLSDGWKQPVVIDNRPGAGGMIGAAGVSRAPADGYTLLFVSSSFTTGAAVQQLPFDPIAGLAAVASVARGPMVLTVNNTVAARSVAELVALAKAQPGKLNFGSAGPGSINHFAAEQLAASAGVKMTHVPYKGMGPATADLIGGHIDVLVASAPSIMQHVKADKVRGLGVTSAAASAFVPGLEPVGATVKGYEVELWWGTLGPPSMPAQVVGQVNAEVNRCLGTQELRDTFAKEGAAPWPQKAEQFGAVIRGDIERWKKVAKDANIKVD
jgi:tripartite-type tricarboxylate transporter receptor subunit TctC